MQHDEAIWGVLNHSFCSYKEKKLTETFCRNSFNVTGICSFASCPLANSRYATILERNGICYLYMKTVERAHMPAKHWERVKLKKGLSEALEQINTHLAFWPRYMIHRVKQRLVKIRQALMRKRRLKLKVRPKVVTVNKKVERRDSIREQKALIAAQLDNSIEKEILNRWNANIYPEKEHIAKHSRKKLFDHKPDDELVEKEPQVELVDEYIEDLDDLEDEEFSNFSAGEEGSDFDYDDESELSDEDDEESEESDEDDEDDKKSSLKRKKDEAQDKKKGSTQPTKKSKKDHPKKGGRKGPYVEIEYERETEKPLQTIW